MSRNVRIYYLALLLVALPLLLVLTSAGCSDEEAAPTEVPAVLAADPGTVAPTSVPPITPTRRPTRTSLPPTVTLTPSAEATATRRATPGASEADALAAASTIAAALPSPTARPSRTPTVTPTRVSEAALRQALISLGDLAPGWQESEIALSTIENADEETTIFLCHELPRRRMLAVEADFSGGELGPKLTERIALYPPGEAERTFEDFLDAAEACNAVTIGMAGGGSERLERQSLDLAELGDETVAVRLSGQPALIFGRPEMDVVAIRHGDYIITLAYFDVGDGLDVANTAALAERAVNKLERLLE